jgi:hypothetical protein
MSSKFKPFSHPFLLLFMKEITMSNANNPTVAILGNGVVGVALAKGFSAQGYQVVFGTRDANSAKTTEALAAVPGARAATFADAARAGQLAVLALPWTGLEAGIEAAGADNWPASWS